MFLTKMTVRRPFAATGPHRDAGATRFGPHLNASSASGKESKRCHQRPVEVPFPFGRNVSNDRGDRGLFYDRKKKAVKDREMIQAIGIIQEDFAGSCLMGGSAGRTIDHIYPIDPGRTSDLGRGENDGWMLVAVVGIDPHADDVPLANRDHRSSGSGSTGREFRYAARSSSTAKCPSG